MEVTPAIKVRGAPSNGYGYGSGYGYGYGYGSGYGDGDGYGYGSGDGDYWAATITGFAAKWSDAQRRRMQELADAGAKIAFWRSDASGSAANGGCNAPVSIGTVERVPGPLRSDCGQGQLHATLLPHKWQGERWWIVALIGEVREQDDKMWALHREVLGECV